MERKIKWRLSKTNFRVEFCFARKAAFEALRGRGHFSFRIRCNRRPLCFDRYCNKSFENICRTGERKRREVLVSIRVTRLGGLLPNGRLFSSASLLKITEGVAQLFGLLFFNWNSFWQKKRFGSHFRWLFSQSHLVTVSSILKRTFWEQNVQRSF
jgi:hypothetical protein